MASRWIQFKLFNYLSQENNTAKDERKKHFPQKSIGILGFIYNQSKKKRKKRIQLKPQNTVLTTITTVLGWTFHTHPTPMISIFN